jgi:hypothetical protein
MTIQNCVTKEQRSILRRSVEQEMMEYGDNNDVVSGWPLSMRYLNLKPVVNIVYFNILYQPEISYHIFRLRGLTKYYVFN